MKTHVANFAQQHPFKSALRWEQTKAARVFGSYSRALRLLSLPAFFQSFPKVDVQSADTEGGRTRIFTLMSLFSGDCFLFSQVHSLRGLHSMSGEPGAGPWARRWLPPACPSQMVPGISSPGDTASATWRRLGKHLPHGLCETSRP